MLMATTSFGQKFYVSKDNIDSFVETVTASPSRDNVNSFKSRYLSKEELVKLVKKNSKK